ncbi:MAG TPA: polyphosphate kinase 1 [Pyrinomonadaceae bacterium]|nr:polyphosphate kinase 1 [Pyrinomonadaceae bacterium]
MKIVASKKHLSEDRRGDASGTTPPTKLMDAKQLLINREFSLMEFFRRVLEEGLDDTQPLLERLKFLAIFSSNVDEFFMIRVSGLKEEFEHEVTELSPDGMTPGDQLAQIRERLLPMLAEQSRCLVEELLPQLSEQGVGLASYNSLSEEEREALHEYFEDQVFPVLTPQAVDPSHPFPYVSNLSLNIGLMVAPLPEHGITSSLVGKIEPRFARIKVPPLVPRLVPIGKDASKFILLEDLIAANANALFPRMRASACHTFRVTRDADIDIREDEADDLLRIMQQTLRKRRFGTAVRLEVASTMPADMVEYLTGSIGVEAKDVYRMGGPLAVTDLMKLYKLDRPDLKDAPFKPRVPAALRRPHLSIFDAIREQDILLHHPYSSFAPVTDFISAAAHDENVAAIKICLYRTGHNSPIPQALIEASEQGKQVTAIIELKARFDEENNIEWAQRLEEAGVHVVYGLMGLKTHCKLALIVRREDETMRRYVHIATGNYNPDTSRAYTDFGLFTADEEIGADASELFNYLTGYSRQKEYRRLMVAPVNMRERMIALIQREAEHARAGRPARMIIKINRLADIEIIHALYEASQAGVEMDLIVRGICMLRPGVEGLSETITVRSVVGQFLEHSRVFYFKNGGEEEFYTGSADWMPRNLNRRVEVVAPVEDARLRRHLKEVVLAAYLRDNVKARKLLPDGSYERIQPGEGGERFDSQLYFMDVKL